MAFRAALVASPPVFVFYPVVATLADIPASQRLVEVGVLIFTNVIGAIVCYTLERANITIASVIKPAMSACDASPGR